MTIRVLIVDDSDIILRVLSTFLAKQPGIEVVGTAPNAFVARDMIVEKSPDVMTLDIDMPFMNGLSFLRRLIVKCPIPTIIVSSQTPANSALAIEALAIGAVEVMCKADSSHGIGDVLKYLPLAIERAARSKIKPTIGNPPQRLNLVRTTNQLVAIGSSTGGVSALEAILTTLPATAPGIVIVQHMPAGFTHQLAVRFATLCAVKVKEAENGDVVSQGHVFIAPGDRHMELERSGSEFIVRLHDGPRVGLHKPAVNVLFHSVAHVVGRHAIGIMLTGMGRDGADGMKEMHDRGAATIAQDEASCVVFGMPKEAIAAGGVDEVIPLDKIAARLLRLAELRSHSWTP